MNFLVNFYGLVYSVGFLIFYVFIQKSKLKKKDLYFYLNFFSIIIFARIYHIISDFYLYKDNLIKIFYIWQGGLAFYGGVIGAFIANLIYLKLVPKDKAEVVNILNKIAIYLPILIFFGRIANYFNHENNGVFPLFPQQFFEALLQGFIPFLLLIFIKKDRFFWFFIFYSIARFITELFRWYFGLKPTHIIDLIFLVLFLITWKKLKVNNN